MAAIMIPIASIQITKVLARMMSAQKLASRRLMNPKSMNQKLKPPK